MTKRHYEKPKMFYEDFELAQSIAGGCEAIANMAKEICSVTVDFAGMPVNVFTEAIIGCSYTEVDGWQGICYHAPSDMNNVFSS